MSHWRIRPALRRYSCPSTCLDRPLQLQQTEAPRISRQSAHEGGKVVTPTHRPHLPPRRYPCTQKAHSLQHSLDTRYRDWFCRVFPYCSQKNAEILLRLKHDSLPFPFQFIFHHLYHSSTQYSTPTVSWNKQTSRDRSVIPACLHFHSTIPNCTVYPSCAFYNNSPF
jgi:hypothetical protein